MLNSSSNNTIKCLRFNYSNNTGSCVNDYETCADQMVCSPENGHHCFVVWNTQLLNRTNVISAGCNPAYKDAPDEKCMGECVGIPKGQRGLFYCCCTGHLCNLNYKLPDMSAQNVTNNTSLLNPSNTSSPTPQKTLYCPAFILSHPIYLVSLVIVSFCLYIFWHKTTRRKYKSQQPNNNIISSNNDQMNNSTDSNSNNFKRNKSLKVKPNQSDLTELRNNNDISVLTPLRNQIDQKNHHNNHSNITNHHQPNQTTRVNEHINSNQHNPQPNGSGHMRMNQQHQQSSQENQCDQNSATAALSESNKQPTIDLSSVKLAEVVGSGRFGIVHRATLPDSEHEVAVKLLPPVEQQSWLNEKEVYSLTRLEHPNISKLLYSGQDPVTENYWLIVDYATHGCLNSYLKDNILDWKDFIHIALGIVHGLSHLHEADVAHRDFKSKNILLKNNLTPCITDFGVAAILDTSAGSQLDHRKKYLQVGTPRYMAPEVLECSVTFTKASFTKIDAYALSLVLWELISRCFPLPTSSQQNYNSMSDNYPNMSTPRVHSTIVEFPIHSTLNEREPLNSPSAIIHCPYENQKQEFELTCPYRLPFEDVAGENPDINTMRQIVVVDKYRPLIKEQWRIYPASEFCRAIEDGWEYDHDARISASCFVERVESLPKVG